MCAIIGGILKNLYWNRDRANAVLSAMWRLSHERGKDGAGYVSYSPGVTEYREISRGIHLDYPKANGEEMVFIGNLRAEPTTEYVSEKKQSDQQPYSLDDWTIVHNGTIANDKKIRTYQLDTKIDSAAIVELLANQKHGTFTAFCGAVKKLQGSYAILAIHRQFPKVLFVAANYRPLWYATNEMGTFFASSRNYFPATMVPQMLEPYTAALFAAHGKVLNRTLRSPTPACSRALVVCSGGLDSVVAATYAKKVLEYDIELIHFLYGSRAQGPETQAVRNVAEALGCPLHLFPLNIYSEQDSPLLDANSKIAGGEKGAEFAYEWVPARNLTMLSVATAFAEARKISVIVLGNNLEEAGAYPDNEPEFIARFNDLLPFAVGDGVQMKVIMPVGNLMKHEIVAMGYKIGAPMHLTWSCYRAGETHCGTCGPCFMRRKAFEINGIPEVITYLN